MKNIRLPQSFFADRREKLAQQLPAHSAVLISGAREQIRNGDVHYIFRQNSYFYYFTGFSEPEAILVLLTDASQKPEYHLFLRPNEPEKELWNGKRLGLEGAKTVLGADKTDNITDFEKQLKDLLQDKKNIYSIKGQSTSFDELLKAYNTQDLTPYVNELRLRKTPEEIQCMQRAIDISVMAHIRGMKVCKPGMFEYELAAEYEYLFLKEGANGHAYPSIVASGDNACILHYTQNDAELKSGELLLVDAGAEYENYSADITRTFPVNGKFTDAQRALYNVVLHAQKSVINALKPGVSYGLAQKLAIQTLTEGLMDLGILKGSLDELVEKKAYLPFYMHGCSHWLGLDTHDSGGYKKNTIDASGMAGDWRLLESGMVMTVEPGLYIRPAEGIAEKWHNIGIRIEDDILITETGCRVMSEGVPKEIEAIESLMR